MKKFCMLMIVAITMTFVLNNLAQASTKGRLNFMLTNFTGVNIVDVRIAPTYYPDQMSVNLLNTNLEGNSRIYIGPNYYGNQPYWNITIAWENGFTHTWTHTRLTRYNSYTVYQNYNGVGLRQGYERSFARYNQSFTPNTYASANPDFTVAVSIPEKVNVAQAPKVAAQSEKKPAENLVVSTRKTRDLVFEDDTEDSVPVAEDTAAAGTDNKITIAVKATVELTRDNKVSTVLPTAEFKSGDKVRLVFSSNSNGYVYWVAKGTSGINQVLFPTKKAGMDNSIVKNREYTVPVKGAWRFDDKKGTETLICMISPNKIPELDKAVNESEAGKKQEASDIIASLVDKHETSRTTRDLVFEEEDEVDVNTKIQKGESGEPFVGIYELIHQ